jgi:hypothetical protein
MCVNVGTWVLVLNFPEVTQTQISQLEVAIVL